MYAVIRTGGKQQKVQVGDVIEVEKIVAEGDTVTFHPILVVDDEGKTHVGKEAEKAVVTAKPMGEKKGEKVKVFKYRPKTGYAKRAGHRQLRTILEVAEVKMGATRRAPAKSAKPKQEADPEPATSGGEAGSG
ncbi:MAG: 50S ribosomal protein L21 [Actinomycetota bacterium]